MLRPRRHRPSTPPGGPVHHRYGLHAGARHLGRYRYSRRFRTSQNSPDTGAAERLVITGRIPHMRVQNWFLCSSPIIRSEDVRSLNVRLHALYGGDPAVVNPSRPRCACREQSHGRGRPDARRNSPSSSNPVLTINGPPTTHSRWLLAQLPEAGAGEAKRGGWRTVRFRHPRRGPRPPSAG